jgi:hypothetical protein
VSRQAERGNTSFNISKQEVSMIKLVAALTVVAILAAMAAVSTIKPKIFHTVGAIAATPVVTISITELQQQVDVRTLPVMQIDDLY